MILVDSSVWAEHFRTNIEVLGDLLKRHQIVCHPFVIGEIMMGNPRNRKGILEEMSTLPQVDLAEDHEVLGFVEQNKIFGTGVGYVDAHLLASLRLVPGTKLWTTDRRMALVAERLDLLASIATHLQ